MTDFLKKIEVLPKDIKSLILSNDSRIILERSCFLYGIPAMDIKNISGEVGIVIIKDIPLDQLPDIISKNLDVPKNIAYGISYELSRYIFAKFPNFFTDINVLKNDWEKLKAQPIISESEAYKKVLEIEPWLEEEKKRQMIEMEREKKVDEEKIEREKMDILQMSIIDALRTYPEIGEQLITEKKIRVGAMPEPVRPSIKNWITDYNFQSGSGMRTAANRVNYLFQNINSRNLTGSERARVSQVLKSLDEQLKLNVNKRLKQIIFSGVTNEVSFKDNNKPQESTVKDRKDVLHELIIKQRRLVQDPIQNQKPTVEKTNIKKMAFSSPQTLSFEKLMSEKELPAPQELELSQPSVKQTVNQGNIVNLKEL